MGASQAGIQNLIAAGKVKELWRRIWFVLGALVVFRMGTFIPVPGVNPEALFRLMEQSSGIVQLFNMFSGGALGRFSLFALGVMPYISASIIIQMLGQTMPALQALRKEGESGRRKLTQYTRYLTVVLAAFQAMGAALALQGQGAAMGVPVVLNPGPEFVISAVVSLTAGTMFLMWLGEQVTERGIGNGISLLIFAGIVAGLPAAIAGTFEMVSTGQLQVITALFILAVAIAVTAFVVFVERGQRRITVNYAKRQGGRMAYQSQSTHLPLKINMAGVIPPIFASSLLLFPGTIADWMSSVTDTRWLQTVAAMLNPGQPGYLVGEAVLILIFAFFYTALVFNSVETADNLKKSGALIPGIRPGKQTADYIDGVMTRLTGAGATYLVLVCMLPTLLITTFSVPFYLGGTSLLIIVVVVMDLMAQTQAHLMTHQYESLMKKANIKGYGGKAGMLRQ